MLEQVIDHINKELVKLFESKPGSKVYGLAQSMIRMKGTTPELLPALVDSKGEGKYIGIDDKSPIITYHKTNSISTRLDESKGNGDSLGKVVNTYAQTLIVYLNRKRVNILPDELYIKIQAVFPESFSLSPFQIVIRFTNVILNSTQVLAAEYQSDIKLPPEASLFAINYTIESAYKKGCFEKCL